MLTDTFSICDWLGKSFGLDSWLGFMAWIHVVHSGNEPLQNDRSCHASQSVNRHHTLFHFIVGMFILENTQPDLFRALMFMTIMTQSLPVSQLPRMSGRLWFTVTMGMPMDLHELSPENVCFSRTPQDSRLENSNMMVS